MKELTICPICGKEKPLDDFDDLDGACAECREWAESYRWRRGYLTHGSS